MNNEEFNHYKLKLRQCLPLEDKEKLTDNRLKQWYEHHDGLVYIGLSGGKDSTVLFHKVRKLFPDVPGVFANTGLEYPEIVKFIKYLQDTEGNIEIIRPQKSFVDIINHYGYPVISKEQASYIEEYRNSKSEKLKDIRINGNKYGRGKISKKWQYLINAPFKISDKCCDYLKKKPFEKYESITGRKAIIGTMASESQKRQQDYKKYGCNSFGTKRQISRPLSFWNDKDIWKYIEKYHIPYSKIYDMGYERTGCVFCGFGCHLDKNKKNKFQTLKETHPRLWDYCINKLNMKDVLNYIGVNYE